MYIASCVFFNIYKIHYGKKEKVKQSCSRDQAYIEWKRKGFRALEYCVL